MSFFDEFTKHIIDTEFYAEEREEYVEKRLNELKKRISSILLSYDVISSKSLIRQIESKVYDEIDSFFEDYNQVEMSEKKEQAEKECKKISNTLKKIAGIGIIATTLKSTKAISAPFNDKSTIYSYLGRLKTDIKTSVNTSLMNSYIFGGNTKEANEHIEIIIDAVVRNAKSDIHTATTAVQRNAERLMLENTGCKVQYISMLDDRTCLECSSHSGEVYKDISEAPHLPRHNRCRCYLVPVKEAGENKTYKKWFEEQNDDTQKKILGRTRYKLWKDGVISLDKFVSKGRKLKLTEIFNK